MYRLADSIIRVQLKTLNLGVSVVVPVYRSTQTLPVLVASVHTALVGINHEIILVDDGSPSATWGVVRSLASSDARVTGVRLGRNAGQHSALLAGVRLANHRVVVTIDDDLQNPPDEIPRLLEALSDDIDVVYGVPLLVAQGRWRRLLSSLYRAILASSFGTEKAESLSSFRAFRTSLRNGFEADTGPSVSLDSMLAWSTSRFNSVNVAHHTRRDGSSNYTARKLLRFAVDTATGYSATPLRFATLLGFGSVMFGFGVLCWVIGRLLVTGESLSGFPFLTSTVTIFAGTQLISLGIIGEYIAKMHFRVMRKPAYVVAEVVNGSQVQN